MNISFFAPPQQVVQYIKKKRAELHFDYDEIMHEAHHRVFTVAKITRLDLLKDIQESLALAAQKGQGFDEWKRGIKDTLARKGWLGDVAVTDPKTGEQKQIYVGDRRLKNIYNTNMRVAYAAARYQSQMSSDLPYFRYVAVLDDRTRASHRALHGLILPKTHPFWDKGYPPNGWNCRCKVQVVDDDDLRREGWSIAKQIPPTKIHPDWAYNVGKTDNLDKILTEKLAKLNKSRAVSKSVKKAVKDDLKDFSHKRDLYVWQASLLEAVSELLIKKNIKSPINTFQVGTLKPNIVKFYNETMQTELADIGIVLNKEKILHFSPERKSKYDQALRIDEIKELVKILDKTKRYFFDKKSKKDILIFWDDEQDKSKINKAVITLDYTIKKFGISNLIVTLGKIDRKDLRTYDLEEIK
ncbi:phage minor head protein [uncultured Campylobacter sp.]|uniref:phage head morphogenesis protein n=1 Tax=uncultured Campylobacter sp. TaxID=218934 RepID=UPI002621C4D4|nr:phage minor head protein [uncultured Campylobacter sp.]